MSQEQLADRLGITRQSVSKWESGAALPELAKLITLSEMFQVSIDYLVKDAEEPKEAEREESRRLEEKVDNIVRYMRGYHYTSKTTIKGVPLVCVRLSRRLGKEGVAKGIIASETWPLACCHLAASPWALSALAAWALEFWR